MAAVNDTTHAVLARPSSRTPLEVHRVLVAVSVILVVIAAIAGVIIAASMGQGEAVIGISLIAGGLVFAAALC